MLLPLRSKNPPERFPFVSVSLAVIILAAFVMTLDGLSVSEGAVDSYAISYATAREPLRWITHLFLHASIWQVFVNLWFLLVVGFAVEGRLGWWKHLIVYFAAGLIGTALYMLFFGPARPTLFLVGSSGATMGVLGVGLFAFPHSKIQCFGVTRFTFGLVDIPLWIIGGVYILWEVMILSLIGSVTVTASIAKVGGFAVGFLLAWLLKTARDDEFVSEAKATLADGGDYTMLNATQLKEMGANQPENADITLAALTRLLRDNFKLDPELLDRFRRQLPGILHHPKQIRSAGWVLSQIKDQAEIDPDLALRLALEVEKQDDFRLAKPLFDWLVRHPGTSDEDRQMAAFRLAMILEVKEMNFVNAEAMYKWLVDTYPMGSMTQMSQARLAAIKPHADRQRGPQIT